MKIIKLTFLVLTLISSTLASAKTITVVSNSDDVAMKKMLFTEVATKPERIGCKEYHWYKITGWFPKEFKDSYTPTISDDTAVFELAKQSLAAKYCEAKPENDGILIVFRVKEDEKGKGIIGFIKVELGVSDESHVTIDCKLVGVGYAQYECNSAKFSSEEDLEIELNLLD